MKSDILYDLFKKILMVVVVLLLTLPQAGAASSRGLAAPNEALPAELKGVPIQDSYTGGGVNAVGEIQSVAGHVVVFREDKQYAYFAAPKDKLFEGDVIYTLKSSRCRFQLYSSDTATLSDNTRILIKTYINNRSTGVKSTSFVMKKGKAIFYAIRLFAYKGSSMDVETPTAVVGVRGTKWGVEVIEGKESASLPIFVADASDLGAFRHLAQANQGGSFTIIHSFEGKVFVESIPPGQITILQGGQSLNAGGAGLGNPYPTPPGTFQGFQGGVEGGGDAAGSPSLPPDISSLIQNQSENQVLQTRPVRRLGYYVGNLTWLNPFPLPVKVNAIFISKSLQDLSSTYAEAVGPALGSVSALNDDKMIELKIGGVSATGLPQPIQRTETGYNAYMVWGYWTQPVSMTILADNFAFVNKGYYVAGDVTAAMPTSISGIYSGSANGTVWTAAGGNDHSGTFSMNVNFAGGTGNVTNFNLSVGNPAVLGASLTGGSGSITGNSFSVTLAPGGVKINNMTGAGVDGGAAYGSFYGPTGQMVGGVWQALVDTASPTPKKANGNFIGSRP